MSSEVLRAARIVLTTFGYIGVLITLIVIPSMYCALVEAGTEIGELKNERDDIADERDLFEIMYIEQCALTAGILHYGYAYTTLEAIREQGGEPLPYKWEANGEVQFDTGNINPNPPGSIIVYTGRGFNGCPEFKFVTMVHKNERVVSPDGMRQMITDWAKGKRVKMPGAIGE